MQVVVQVREVLHRGAAEMLEDSKGFLGFTKLSRKRKIAR